MLGLVPRQSSLSRATTMAEPQTEKPGLLDHSIEESCPSIRDTHFELQVRRLTLELWEAPGRWEFVTEARTT